MDLMANSKFVDFITKFQSLMASTQKVSLIEARKESTKFFCPPTLAKEKVHKIMDKMIKGRDGHEIPLRLYVPNEEKKLPVLIYYHRGGWVFSNIEEADPVCRKFANYFGCIVVSVDYRLAPENPFPKPLEDCYDAFSWVFKHASEIGADKNKIIVAGESAGGNLAAAVAMQARDQGAPSILAQLLIYPIISSTINEKAYEACADRYFLTKDGMKFFWSMYIQNEEDRKNPYASLEHAVDHSGLPQTLIITAEHDPLRIEAEAYGLQLKKAGNTVIVEKFPGVIHGFLDLPLYSDKEVAAWLKVIRSKLDPLLK